VIENPLLSGAYYVNTAQVFSSTSEAMI